MDNAHPRVYGDRTAVERRDWRAYVPEGVRPYIESAPLAALFLGVSSGFAYAMIGATLTTRLAQYGIQKSAVTMFALTFLAYNFKFLWAPLVDNVRIPVLGRFGQRRSWLWLTGLFVMAAVGYLGSLDPQQALSTVALAAILVGFAGATFDIIIDAYRIELLEPRQLGVGSGMSQYRLEDRRHDGRRPRARRRCPLWMGRRVQRVCSVCAAGNAGRRRHGRARAAS